MTEKTESFADLFGACRPIKRPAQVENFGRQIKVLRRRQINTLDTRLPLPQWRTELNLAPIAPARFQQLCRGMLPVAREIDLHGWFVDEGLRFLRDALEERDNFRPEIWHIVHGKGRHSPYYDRAPLKQAVLDFLRHYPAVNALAELRDRDGQSGAVVIEVSARPRRQKKGKKWYDTEL